MFDGARRRWLVCVASAYFTERKTVLDAGPLKVRPTSSKSRPDPDHRRRRRGLVGLGLVFMSRKR